MLWASIKSIARFNLIYYKNIYIKTHYKLLFVQIHHIFNLNPIINLGFQMAAQQIRVSSASGWSDEWWDGFPSLKLRRRTRGPPESPPRGKTSFRSPETNRSTSTLSPVPSPPWIYPTLIFWFWLYTWTLPPRGYSIYLYFSSA